MQVPKLSTIQHLEPRKGRWACGQRGRTFTCDLSPRDVCYPGARALQGRTAEWDRHGGAKCQSTADRLGLPARD